MRVTSDGAKKLLDKLNEERDMLKRRISDLSFYVAAVSENAAELAPEFNFVEANQKLDQLNMTIAKIRHARNVFNTTTIVKDTVVTIDAVLIEMAMLEKDVSMFKAFATAQAKTRCNTYGSNDIEYKYANFDIETSQRIYEEKRETLAMLKQKLDYTNSTETFEIDLD